MCCQKGKLSDSIEQLWLGHKQLATFFLLNTAQLLDHSLVTYSLDSCKTILSVPSQNKKKLFNRLQTVQSRHPHQVCWPRHTYSHPASLHPHYSSVSGSRLCFSLLKLWMTWDPRIFQASFTLIPLPVPYTRLQLLSWLLLAWKLSPRVPEPLCCTSSLEIITTSPSSAWFVDTGSNHSSEPICFHQHISYSRLVLQSCYSLILNLSLLFLVLILYCKMTLSTS